MPNRTLSGAEAYRYAYQGQEKDPETGKEAFELRLWDGRIGRWLTTDPAGQYSSPYLGMGNNPISGIDPDGGFYTRFGAWLYRYIYGTGGEIVQNDYGKYFLDVSDGSGEVNMIFGHPWEAKHLFNNNGGTIYYNDGVEKGFVTFASPELEHAKEYDIHFKVDRTGGVPVIFRGHEWDEAQSKVLNEAKSKAVESVSKGLGTVLKSKPAETIINEVTDEIIVLKVETVTLAKMYVNVYYYGAEKKSVFGWLRSQKTYDKTSRPFITYDRITTVGNVLINQ